MDGTAGYTINDLVLVTNGGSCMMTQVTQVQDAASHLQHNPGQSLWNPAGGGSPLPAFPAGSNLFNLGNPIWRTYSIDSAATKSKLQFQEVVTSRRADISRNRGADHRRHRRPASPIRQGHGR